MLGKPPQQPLRVAAVQAAAVPGDVLANVATATRLTERAARDGAALVVFPELFVPAYHPPTLAARPADCDVRADAAGQVCDVGLAPLKAAAADLGVAVLIGASVRHADQRRTISLLVVAAGQAAVAYDKQHLWGADEPRLFSPGQRGSVLSCSGWRLGLGICYDVSFPEHARSAALAGAHAYICPSVFLVGRDHRWRTPCTPCSLTVSAAVTPGSSAAGPGCSTRRDARCAGARPPARRSSAPTLTPMSWWQPGPSCRCSPTACTRVADSW